MMKLADAIDWYLGNKKNEDKKLKLPSMACAICGVSFDRNQLYVSTGGPICATCDKEVRSGYRGAVRAQYYIDKIICRICANSVVAEDIIGDVCDACRALETRRGQLEKKLENPYPASGAIINGAASGAMKSGWYPLSTYGLEGIKKQVEALRGTDVDQAVLDELIARLREFQDPNFVNELEKLSSFNEGDNIVSNEILVTGRKFRKSE